LQTGVQRLTWCSPPTCHRCLLPVPWRRYKCGRRSYWFSRLPLHAHLFAKSSFRCVSYVCRRSLYRCVPGALFTRHLRRQTRTRFFSLPRDVITYHQWRATRCLPRACAALTPRRPSWLGVTVTTAGDSMPRRAWHGFIHHDVLFLTLILLCRAWLPGHSVNYLSWRHFAYTCGMRVGTLVRRTYAGRTFFCLCTRTFAF